MCVECAINWECVSAVPARQVRKVATLHGPTEYAVILVIINSYRDIIFQNIARLDLAMAIIRHSSYSFQFLCFVKKTQLPSSVVPGRALYPTYQ